MKEMACTELSLDASTVMLRIAEMSITFNFADECVRVLNKRLENDVELLIPEFSITNPVFN